MYESLQQMQEICETENKAFWELVMEEEANEKQNSHEEVFEMMRSMYRAMVQADENYEDRRSASQMTGGAGELMAKWNRDEKTLSGPFLGQVMERALKMAESNACMKRIVAAPTAGSCGVVPAVFLSVQEERGFSEECMVEALYVAAGIGGVIANRAFLAGAAGGCQAEIGSASAMAAGGVTYLLGGGADEIANCLLYTSPSPRDTR